MVRVGEVEAEDFLGQVAQTVTGGQVEELSLGIEDDDTVRPGEEGGDGDRRRLAGPRRSEEEDVMVRRRSLSLFLVLANGDPRAVQKTASADVAVVGEARAAVGVAVLR